MTYALISDAVADMLDLFLAVWVDEHDAPLPGDYPGVEFDTADLTPADTWAKWRCDHNEQGQASLATADGKRKWERNGLISIELFCPQSGATKAYNIAEKVLRAYQGKRTPGDAWFRRVRLREGDDVENSGVWIKMYVVAEFTYEQVS